MKQLTSKMFIDSESIKLLCIDADTKQVVSLQIIKQSVIEQIVFEDNKVRIDIPNDSIYLINEWYDSMLNYYCPDLNSL
jgi:hypothetical protein